METKETQAIKIIWASSLTLTFFWILNILKEGIPGVKNFLNFYPPVGPLLGLFLFSILSLFIFLIIFNSVKPKDQKLAFWVGLISPIIFLVMTFPPIFKMVINLFK